MFGSSVLNRRLRTTVLITLKSGEAFTGILWEADKLVFVLRNSSMASPTTNPSPEVSAVDGELVLLVADVAYMQIP